MYITKAVEEREIRRRGDEREKEEKKETPLILSDRRLRTRVAR